MTELTVDVVDSVDEVDGVGGVDSVDAVQTVPVPQAAWATLERLQLAAQVSQQQLQVFVDGLALGQGVAQGAQLSQMPQCGWAWVPGEVARRD